MPGIFRSRIAGTPEEELAEAYLRVEGAVTLHRSHPKERVERKIADLERLVGLLQEKIGERDEELTRLGKSLLKEGESDHLKERARPGITRQALIPSPCRFPPSFGFDPVIARVRERSYIPVGTLHWTEVMHMQDIFSFHQRIPGALVTGGVFLILLSTLVVFPSAARTDIRHIGVGDTIFVYEQNLDITGLRTFANPITALRKYNDDNPTLALLREIPVQDDTSFSPIPEAFGGLYGIYYAFNPTDGAMNSVLVTEPSVSIDVVLANPNHRTPFRGSAVSRRTPRSPSRSWRPTWVRPTMQGPSTRPPSISSLPTPGGAPAHLYPGDETSRG